MENISSKSPDLRPSARINAKLDRNLVAYVAAASAVAAGIMAAADTAEASVVYTQANLAFSNNQDCRLDLNGDGVADFVLRDKVIDHSSGHDIVLSVLGQAAGNSVMGIVSNNGRAFADARNQGAKISFAAGLPFGILGAFSSSCAGNHYVFGRWVNVQNKYLALKFVVDGEIHFGWARLSVHVNSEFLNAYLTGYAYETVPGKAIVAGQTSDVAENAGALEDFALPSVPPPSLGLLALGADGVSIWRRE